jgi:hypothetical protein
VSTDICTLSRFHFGMKIRQVVLECVKTSGTVHSGLEEAPTQPAAWLASSVKRYP